MRQLIITCDDCGLSEGINLATAKLHQKGMATAASVMTNLHAAQHALQLFTRYPSLDVGVHLNLTEGFSLTQVGKFSSLTYADGRFRSRIRLFAQSLFPSISFLTLVQRELTAQIRVFLQAGFHVQHLTTHLHFHVLPDLREIVFRLAREFRISWVRAYALSAILAPFNPLLQRRVISPESNGVESLSIPDYVVQLKDWMDHDPEHLFDQLVSLQGSIELVVHPSLAPDETLPIDTTYPCQKRFDEMCYLERLWQILQAKAPDTIVIGSWHRYSAP